MTATLTGWVPTFGGFLPLILEGGGFWPPFATAVAGGVVLSTLLSFYFVPAAFALVARKQARADTPQRVVSTGAGGRRLSLAAE